MEHISKLVVRIGESRRGQTMTEYVLIIAAIALAGYVAYQGLEGGINTFITVVTTSLSGA
jgi:Flp pilus assembly pilin Flp